MDKNEKSEIIKKTFGLDKYFAKDEKKVLNAYLDAIGFKNLDECIIFLMNFYDRVKGETEFETEQEAIAFFNTEFIIAFGNELNVNKEKLSLIDESKFKEVITKLNRVFSFVLAYKGLDFTPDEIRDVLGSAENNLQEMFFINDIDITEAEKIIDKEKILQNIENYKNKDKLYYTDYTLRKLIYIHDELVIHKLIEKNEHFIDSFRNFNVKNQHKTNWIGKQTTLMYFVNKMFDKTPQNKIETIPEIALKLFTSKKTNNNLKQLRQVNTNISHYLTGKTLPPTHLSIIDEIIS